jgi:hypothetical protein
MDGSKPIAQVVRAMTNDVFVAHGRPTPLKSAFKFLLEQSGYTQTKEGSPGKPMPFTESNFVFAIVLVGLNIRDSNGLYQFVEDNQVARGEEYPLTNRDDAKKLEFHLLDLSNGQLTKTARDSVEHGVKRLRQAVQEGKLAQEMADLLAGKSPDGSKYTLAQANSHMIHHHGLNSHGLVRIRRLMISTGMYNPPRRKVGMSFLKHLAPDNAKLIERYCEQKKVTAHQALDQILFDYRRMFVNLQSEYVQRAQAKTR